MSGTVRYVRAQYSYTELAAWRGKLRPALTGQAGVVSLDLDEQRNALTVGLERSASGARNAVAAVLAGLDIPTGAVRYDEVEQLVRGSALEAGLLFRTQTLEDRVRPIVAGLQIEFNTSSYCTIGWVTENNSAQGAFVTASHCSTDEGTVDPTVYYQYGFSLSEGNHLGAEAYEATEYLCNGSSPCHYGDVNGVVIDSTSYAANEVARTSSGITINGSTYVLNEAYDYSVIGMSVSKTGLATGATSGQVTMTCADYQGGNGYWAMCLDAASYGSDSGDSGAPVYSVTSSSQSTAKFAGVHSGRMFVWSCVCHRAVFTPARIIFSELSSLVPLPM